MRNRWILRFKPIIVLTLSLAMIIPNTGCKKEDTLLNEQPMVAMDANNAIEQLANAEVNYGYENALSELTEKSTSTIDGDSYYRLQQNYNGIPVYGRTVVCVTDKDGNVTSVIGNVQDIDPNINLTPSITSAQAQESIRAYVTEVLEQADTDITSSEPITCIYNGNKLAYIYTVTTEGNFFVTHEVLVDAHDAGILEWNTYAASFDTNLDILVEANVACESDDSNNLKLTDARRNHSVYYLDLKTSKEYPTLEAVVGNDGFLATAVPGQTASGETYALARLAQISDFYTDILGRNSYDNQGGIVYVFSCDADLLADNGKSLAYPEYGIIMLGEPVDIFSEPLGKALDLVAHEYAHLVFQTEVGLSKDLTVASVNEGIADIFGNLIELYVNGEQDAKWPLAEDAGYNKYNMADSITMASYGNEEHDNAQILSHSAYLMWNGIDGNDSKRLSTEELAELWYRAVLMMPSDCDFILCRQLVEVATQSMETLSDEQRECVREAFDRVGIPSTREDTFYPDYRLNKDATLMVYDQNNEPYSGYTLQINGTIDMSEIASNMTPDIGWVVNRTDTVEEPGAYALDLPQGRYMLTITDRYYDESYSIYVEISNDHTETNIDLITAYEEPLVVVIKPNTQKQLSTIVTYQNGEKSEEYHFTYNDCGQVVGMAAYRYEDGNAIKWYTQSYEYDGKGNPTFKEHVASTGYTQSYQYQYDYDSNGRITGYSSIEYYEDTPGFYETYILSYDDQGRVIGRRDEYGSSVEDFSYNESAKTVYESSELHWGDGHFIETTAYDYTYAPLVISTHTSESKEYGNSSSKSISFMPHWNLSIASCNIDDSCSYETDSSGYLTRVIGTNGDDIYVCTYEDRQVKQTNNEKSNVHKRLRRVDSYWDGEEISTYLHYDDKGFLERMTCSDGSPDSLYEYDEMNRLVKITNGNMDEYIYGEFSLEFLYDENGRIAGWKRDYSVFESEEGCCVYDGKGRLIRTVVTHRIDTYSATTQRDFAYDEAGLLVEAVVGGWDAEGYHSDSVIRYQYDAQNRVSLITTNNAGHYFTDEYIYTYYPFVIIQKDTSIEAYYDLGYLSNMNVYLQNDFREYVYYHVSCKLDELTADDEGYLQIVNGTAVDGGHTQKVEFVWEPIMRESK